MIENTLNCLKKTQRMTDLQIVSSLLGVEMTQSSLVAMRNAMNPYWVFNANVSKSPGEDVTINYISENTLGSYTVESYFGGFSISFDDHNPNIDGSPHMVVAIQNLIFPSSPNRLEIFEFYGNTVYYNIMDSLRNEQDSLYEAIIEIKFLKDFNYETE